MYHTPMPYGSRALCRIVTVPPLRHFSRPVVVVHGVSAAAAIALVLLAVFFKQELNTKAQASR